MTITTTEPNALAPTPGSTGASMIREAAAVMVDAHSLAKAVCNTQMIPKHFQGKPDECAAAMLYGASLGLDPMQSVRQIYVIHGQAALYARAMSALTQGAGHQVWTVDSTDSAVTVGGKRRGSEREEQVTWTYDRANKAGYTSNSKYKTDPQAMLYAKALSEVCRKIAPDVLSGIYSVEELEMERWDEPRRVAATEDTSAPARMAHLLGAAPEQPAETAAPETLDTSSRVARHMFALLSEMVGSGRDDQLAYVSRVLDRPIESRAEMTTDDAVTVVDALIAEREAKAGDDQ